MLANRWHNGYRSGVTVSDAPRVEVTCVVDPHGKEPAEATAWITSSDGQWEATGHFRVARGQVICTRLNVGAATPGITSSFLRTLPMGTILTLVRSALAEQADRFEAAAEAVGPASDFGQSTRAAAAHLRPQLARRGRPRKYPDSHYQRIAHAYLALQGEGWSRGRLQLIRSDCSTNWRFRKASPGRRSETGSGQPAFVASCPKRVKGGPDDYLALAFMSLCGRILRPDRLV